jgi:hypothetical protein
MFALLILILAIWGTTAALLLGGTLNLSAETKLYIFVGVGFPGIFALGALTNAINHRTQEPYKPTRLLAVGAFSLGILSVVGSSVYRVQTEQGGHTYALLGPQHNVDVQMLYYGAAMLVLAPAAYLVPITPLASLLGVGVAIGGAMQVWVAITMRASPRTDDDAERRRVEPSRRSH